MGVGRWSFPFGMAYFEVQNVSFRVVSCTSWWFQLLWKIIVKNGFIFPNFRGEKKKSLKPPPSVALVWYHLVIQKHGEHEAETGIFVEARFLGVRWPGNLRSLLGGCWGLASILTFFSSLSGEKNVWVIMLEDFLRECTRSFWEDMMYSVTYPSYKKQLRRYPKCNTTSHHWI